jgi:hypothetical protein
LPINRLRGLTQLFDCMSGEGIQRIGQGRLLCELFSTPGLGQNSPLCL